MSLQFDANLNGFSCWSRTTLCYATILLLIMLFLHANAMYDETSGVTIYIQRDDQNWSSTCQLDVSIGLQDAQTRLHLGQISLNIGETDEYPTIQYPSTSLVDFQLIASQELSKQTLSSTHSNGMSPFPIQTEKDTVMGMYKIFTSRFSIKASDDGYKCADLTNKPDLYLSISFCAEYIQYGVDMGYPCNNMRKARYIDGSGPGGTTVTDSDAYMTTIRIKLEQFLQINHDNSAQYKENTLMYILPTITEPVIGKFVPPLNYPSAQGIYRAYVSHTRATIMQPQSSTQLDDSVSVGINYIGDGLTFNPQATGGNHTFEFDLPQLIAEQINFDNYYSLVLTTQVAQYSAIEISVQYPYTYTIPICSLLSGYDLSSISEDDRNCDYTQPTEMLDWTNLPCKDGHYGYKHWCSLPRSFGSKSDYPFNDQASVEVFLPDTLDPKESYCYTRFIDESTGILGPLSGICPLWMRYMLSYTIQPSCEILTDNHRGIASIDETPPTATITSPSILYDDVSYYTPVDHRLFPSKPSLTPPTLQPVEGFLMVCSISTFICDQNTINNNICQPPEVSRLNFSIITGDGDALQSTGLQFYHGKTISLVSLNGAIHAQKGVTLIGRLSLSTSTELTHDDLEFIDRDGNVASLDIRDPLNAIERITIQSLCEYYNQICTKSSSESSLRLCTDDGDVYFPKPWFLPISPVDICVCNQEHHIIDPYTRQSLYYMTTDNDKLCQQTSTELPQIYDMLGEYNTINNAFFDYQKRNNQPFNISINQPAMSPLQINDPEMPPVFRISYGSNIDGKKIPWPINKLFNVSINTGKISPLWVGDITRGNFHTGFMKLSYQYIIIPLHQVQIVDDNVFSYIPNYDLMHKGAAIEAILGPAYTPLVNIDHILKNDQVSFNWPDYYRYQIVIALLSEDKRTNPVFRVHDPISLPYSVSYFMDLSLYNLGLEGDGEDDSDSNNTSPCILDCTLIRGGSYCNPDTRQCECNDLTLTYTPQQQCMPPCPCMNKGVCRYPSYVLGTALDALTYTCQCPTGYQGPLCQIVVVKPYTPQPTCLLSSFNPKICTMGTVLCPLDGSNRPECQCQGHWGNSPHADNTGTYCDLCLSDDDNNPDRCDKIGTHPVSYTRERCSPNKCVCAKGYTGSRCQHYALYADIIFTLDQNNIPPIEIDGKTIDINDYRSIILTYLKNNMLPTLNKPLSHLTLVELKEYIEIYNVSRHYDTITNNIIQYDLTLVMNPTNISQLVDAEPYIITDLLLSSSSIHTIQQISIADIISDISSQWSDITDGLSSIGDGNLGTPTSNPPYDSSICLPDNNSNTTTPPPDPTTCPAPPEFRDTTYDEEYKGSLDLDFLASPPDRGSTASKVGSVVGIIVGCCIAFIILLIVIIWAKKAKKLCFKPREKKKSNSNTKTIKSCERSSSGGTQMAVLSETKSDAPPVSPASTHTGTNHGPSSTIPTPVPGNDGEKLPQGWNKVRDPATGKKYYLNDLTLETSWDAPNPDGTKATSGSDLGW